jgi:hypothetical protein
MPRSKNPGPPLLPAQLLSELGRPTLGIVTVASLEQAGGDRRQLSRRAAARTWARTTRGVYVPRVGDEICAEQIVLSAALGVPKSIVIGWSAAVVRGLTVPENEGLAPVQLGVAAPRHSRRPGVHRISGPLPFMPWHAVRVATPALIVVTVTASGESAWRVERLLDDVLTRRMTTVAKVHALIHEPGWTKFRGRGHLTAALNARADGRHLFRSNYERSVKRWITRAGLPAPKINHLVNTSAGPIEVDFAWPELRVNLEVSPFVTHGSRRATRRDIDRRNALFELGWRVIEADERHLVGAHCFQPILRSLHAALIDLRHV